jgi:hypothetical protein
MTDDDIDTAPIILKDNPRVTHESIDLSPSERAEIVLSPHRAIRSPTLFMLNEGRQSQVIIEQVMHGRALIIQRDRQIEDFKFGHKLDVVVTDSEPIKIVLINVGSVKTTVGASLVTANEQKINTTYRLKGSEIKE